MTAILRGIAGLYFGGGAATLQGIGAAARGRFVASAGSEIANSVTREISIAANLTAVAAGISHVPSPEALLNCLYAETLTEGQVRAAMACHGIILPREDTFTRGRDTWWQGVRRSQEPTMSIQFARKQVLQGKWNRVGLESVMRREGLGPWIDDYYDESNNLDLRGLLHLWMTGRIDMPTLYARARMLGWFPPEIDLYRQASYERPGLGETQQLYLRGVIDSSTYDTYLKSLGYWEQDPQNQIRKLRWAMPSPGDVFGSAGRRAWDDQFAADWGMDGEQPNELSVWAARLGLNHTADGSPYGTEAIAGDPHSWAGIYWRDHWRVMDTGMLVRVLQRFRGDPTDPNTWSNPDVRPLTPQQVDRLLSANGIPPAARPYLLNLVYQPVGLRHIRMVQTYNPQSRDWVIARYADAGFSPSNSILMGDALLADIEAARNRPIHAAEVAAFNRLLRATTEAYKVGSLTADQATGGLINAGIPRDTAQRMVTTAQLEIGTETMKKIIGRARSDVFAGRTTVQGAVQRLVNAGADPGIARQYGLSFQAEFGEGRRMISTGKILALLRKGYIGPDEALQRLTNLGWANADTLLLLAEVQGQINKDAAATQAAADRATAKQIGDVQKLINQNNANAAKLVARARQLTPPSAIMKWLRRGIWTPAQAQARLTFLGYDPATIASMLAEAAAEQAGGPQTSAAAAEQRQAKLKRLYPIARTVNFYRDGIWTRADAEAKLALVGVPPDEIKALLDEADIQKPK